MLPAIPVDGRTFGHEQDAAKTPVVAENRQFGNFRESLDTPVERSSYFILSCRRALAFCFQAHWPINPNMRHIP